MKKIILGSASPRRKELLSQIGVPFEVRVSNKEEVYTNTVPKEIVKELALMKAENVASDSQIFYLTGSGCRTSYGNRYVLRCACADGKGAWNPYAVQ